MTPAHGEPPGFLAIGARKVPSIAATVLIVEAGVEENNLPGAGDHSFDRPTVTPVPAPPDDQLIRLAAVGSVLGALAGLIALRWLHKHVDVSWRR